ncbi:MAG: type II secretion system F family protein [Myxococcota bacterium]
MNARLTMSAGLVLVTLSVSCLVYLVFSTERNACRVFFDLYGERLEARTRFLRLRVSGGAVARAQLFGVAFFVVVGLAMESSIVFVLALMALLAPPFVLSQRCIARVRKLERQLEGWLLMLVGALRATPSALDAVSTTLSLVPRPFSEEVDLVVKEVRLGSSLRRALTNMSARSRSAAISSALTTILIAGETGGDLPKVLQTTAESLRESSRLEGVLRTKTAEGRGQLALMAAMPFVLFLAIRWFDPNYFVPVVTEPQGRVILFACGCLWVVAFIWAYQIVRLDL